MPKLDAGEKPMANLVVTQPKNAAEARKVCTQIRTVKNHRFFIRMKRAGGSNNWLQEMFVIKNGGETLGPFTYNENAFKAKIISIVNSDLDDVKFG